MHRARLPASWRETRRPTFARARGRTAPRGRSPRSGGQRFPPCRSQRWHRLWRHLPQADGGTPRHARAHNDAPLAAQRRGEEIVRGRCYHDAPLAVVGAATNENDGMLRSSTNGSASPRSRRKPSGPDAQTARCCSAPAQTARRPTMSAHRHLRAPRGAVEHIADFERGACAQADVGWKPRAGPAILWKVLQLLSRSPGGQSQWVSR